MKKILLNLTLFFKQIDFSWRLVRDFFLILLGGFIQALALRLFLLPADLISGGVSGIAQLIHHFTKTPIGLMVLLGNIPLFVLGWRYLGGPRFALRTILAILSFSIFTDVLVYFLPSNGVTTDIFLDSLFGGLLMGVGLGIVYRGRGTSGGSDILGRILNAKFGIQITHSYLITDSLIVLSAGLVFGWEKALYALVMIYVSGLSAEVVSQGVSLVRTAFIISDQVEKVAEGIVKELERSATMLPGVGAYTGESRKVLYCVITTSEVNRLKAIVHEIDPKAFMVIGDAHEALGEGFKPLRKPQI